MNKEKKFKVWIADQSVRIQPDTTTEDTSWWMELSACRGEYENIQLVLRAEDEPVKIKIELENLLQALGEKIFDAKNIQLRMAEGDRLIPLPDEFILEPQRTQAIWLTVYIPRETEPGAYQTAIRLRTDTVEIEVTVSLKVPDIDLSEINSFDLLKSAERYGLKQPLDACIRELEQRGSESSIRVETLRDGLDNFKLLWLLEQAQITLAEQQGLNPDEFDPTAFGKEICAPIMKKLADPGTGIKALYEVRVDIIFAIKKAQIPHVDLGDTLTVKAIVAPTTPADYAYGTVDRFNFRFGLEWSPLEMVQPGDYLRFTFRDLFSDECTFFECPLKSPISGKTTVVITAEDLKLKASCFHVRTDVMRNGHSLSPNAPGACQIYVTREGESPKHLFASFSAARMAYMWDENRSIYYHLLPGNLSPTGDPFDPAARPLYEQALRFEIVRMRYDDWTGRHPMESCVPEAQHDGGSGILRTAEIFRQMDEPERALFCEQVVKRIVNAVLNRKIETCEQGQPGITFSGPRQQHNILLKLLCDTCLHFRGVGDDKAYAQELYQSIKLIGEYQMTQPNEVGASEGKVYDGRVLVGLATYCLTDLEVNGQFNKAHVQTVLDFARKICDQTLLHQGWHDYAGPEGHDGYGTMNVIWGLLPARKIALATGHDELAEAFKKGILTGFDFLARTNGAITGYTQWIPSRHGGWCAGDTYLMLDEIGRQFGETKILKWYRKHLCDRDIVYFARLVSGYGETSSLGSHNALPAYLMESEEYKNAVSIVDY